MWLTIPRLATVGPTELAFALRPAGTASRVGSVAVSCALPRAGTARVELFDVSGRRIDSRDLSMSGPGTQRVELGRGLASGLYFVQLRAGGDVARLKQVIAR